MKEYKISREAQDKYALESQTKTQEAIQGGHFKKEIVGVVDKKTGKVFDTDEFPRAGTTLEGLAKLRPVFDPVC